MSNELVAAVQKYVDTVLEASNEDEGNFYVGDNLAYEEMVAALRASPAAPEAPIIVTLCGSTRFKKEFEDANKSETLAGRIVLSCGVFGHDPDEPELSDEAKNELDELHKRKIDLSDEILVINVGGYIGKSTRGEIEYSKAHGKRIRYLVPAAPEGGEKCTCGHAIKDHSQSRADTNYQKICTLCSCKNFTLLPASPEPTRRELGEKPECDCAPSYEEEGGVLRHGCPVHDPKNYRPAQPAAQSAEPNLTIDLTAILPDMPESKYVLMARYVAALEVVGMCVEALRRVANKYGMDDGDRAAIAAASAILKREAK